MLAEYQLAKVLVCRQQNGLFLVCQMKRGIVGDPRLHLGDIVNQVPVLSQAINDLPISIVLSWMEQKAVIILLALFSLGIKDIYLGPKPPQFVNEDIFNFLAEHFNLHLTGDAREDLQKLLIEKAA